MSTTETREKTHSEQQAQAQLESIIEMVKALDNEDEATAEQARETIHEDPLSIEVRSGWTTPGCDMKAAEFCILLCTGGPACRIIGDLDEHDEPETCRIEHQDWGTPWTDYPLNSTQREYVLTYCRNFCFA